MKQRSTVFEILTVSLFAIFFSGISAIAYGADNDQGNSGFQLDAAARAADLNAANGKENPYSIQRPGSDLQPMTAGEKYQYYLRNAYGPESVVLGLAVTGINQARDTVPQWGQGMEGFGKRFASSYGRKAVRCSIQMGLGGLLHEDPRYFPSGKTGFFKRMFYAGGQAFVARKDDGGMRPGYSKFIGAFGSAYISRQWHPESYHTPQDYFSSGAASIGFDVARNIFREFWGDLKKKLHP